MPSTDWMPGRAKYTTNAAAQAGTESNGTFAAVNVQQGSYTYRVSTALAGFDATKTQTVLAVADRTFDGVRAFDRHMFSVRPTGPAPIAREEVHICLGSRFLEKRSTQMPVLRRFTLRGAVLFMRLTSRMHLTDAHNGFRAFSRDAARGLDLQLDRMAHASEIVDQFYASGLSYREVPVRVRYTEYSLRKGQKSSAALRVAFDYLLGRLTR